MKVEQAIDAIDSRSWIKAADSEPFRTTRNSVLFVHADGLLKFHKPQRLIKDQLRRFVGRSLADKEIRGYHRLKRLGLRTPRVIGKRMLWNPLGRFESISATEYLSGKISAKAFLQHADDHQRETLLRHFAEDLQTMWNAWILYWDLHLDNLLVGDDALPHWIDPDLQIFGSYAAMRKASDRVLGRFIRLNHLLLGPAGVARVCALQLPRQRRINL